MEEQQLAVMLPPVVLELPSYSGHFLQISSTKHNLKDKFKHEQLKK